MDNCFRVGVITATQGLKGEVRIYPTTDDPRRYSYLKEVWVDMGREKELLEITHVRYYKQMVIASFKDKNRIEDIEKYLKKDLYVTRENAVPLEENEYYISDLIGLKAVDEQGKVLGILEDVLQTGANDVYVIKRDEPADGADTIMIPAVSQFVLNVDMNERVMTVRLIAGM